MAQVRQVYAPDHFQWVDVSATASIASQTTFKVATDLTTAFVANRRARLRSGSTTRYMTIVSSSFTTETTVTVTVDSGSLSASHSIAAVSALTTDGVPRNTFAVLASTNTFSATNVFLADVAVQGGISVSGAANFRGTVSVSGAANFLTTMSVSGAANFVGPATFLGTATFAGGVAFAATVSFSATAVFAGTARFLGTVTFSGAAVHMTAVGFGGTVSFSAQAVFGGPVTFGATVSFSATTVFGGQTIFNSGVTFASTATFSGAAVHLGPVGFGATVSFSAPVTVAGTLNVTGTAAFGATVSFSATVSLAAIAVSGTASFAAAVYFDGSTVNQTSSLTDAVSITWAIGTGGPNYSVTLAGNRTLAAPTGDVAGQHGLLSVVQDATGARTLAFNAAYKVIGGLTQFVDPTASATTVFEYQVRGVGDILLWKVWTAAQDSIGWYREYDFGTFALSTADSAAHLLGRYPSAAQAWLENLTTDQGYSLGDRVDIVSLTDEANANKAVALWMSTATIGFATGSVVPHLVPKTGGAAAGITAGSWKIITRVYE